ncbi:hypothetical protein ACE193_21480 [Bernardetia sp. OM2101]|uniref:hypothetical protein n=1 Tax=Bernardetia sp. OM2101 TaxID=3344876 RepID=UPI0035CE9E20
MKNLSIIFILLSFCVLFFSACKKEDELSTREKLIGVWTHQSIQTTVYDEGDEIIEDYTRDYVGTTEYKSDDRFVSDNDGFVISGSWELIDDTSLLTEHKLYRGPGIDSLTRTTNITIIELTENRFVSSYEIDDISNETGSVKINTTSTLVK